MRMAIFVSQDETHHHAPDAAEPKTPFSKKYGLAEKFDHKVTRRPRRKVFLGKYC